MAGDWPVAPADADDTGPLLPARRPQGPRSWLKSGGAHRPPRAGDQTQPRVPYPSACSLRLKNCSTVRLNPVNP